jgi:hypothetical protein
MPRLREAHLLDLPRKRLLSELPPGREDERGERLTGRDDR